ncbi:MAG: hypothetical protein J3R72DRAFT_529261 [Linnemannia gamsii]|nr:MAG: hypothetical protein J3R72DRAFT_529261 [Linnemannia gamsii]
MVSRLQRILSKLQSKKPQEEGTQAVRVGPLGSNKIYYITTHSDPSSSNKSIILWNDILVVYPNALFIQHDTRVIPFLKGKDFKDLEPRRFAAIPSVVLEVVVHDPMATTTLASAAITTTPPTTTAIPPPTTTTTTQVERNRSDTKTASTTASTTATAWTNHSRSNNNTVVGLAPMENIKTEIDQVDDNNDNNDINDPDPAPNNTQLTSTRFGSAIATPSPTITKKNTIDLISGLDNARDSGSLATSSPYAVDIARTLSKTMRHSDPSPPSLGQRNSSSVKNGRRVSSKQDNQLAVDWFLDKAKRGSVEAQIEIGHRYGTGQGVPLDFAKALEWYLKAAKQGNADAQCCIGFMYERGQGIPRNDSTAMKWYLKAAEQGNPPAQINIGFMFERGQGAPQDYSRAFDWYLKAARQGFAQAQTNLGFMYQHGQGTPRNYSKALEWYLKAAEQGATAAQMNLGCLYHYGLGVPRDYVKALMWYQKAASQGDPQVLKQIDILKRQTSTRM